VASWLEELRANRSRTLIGGEAAAAEAAARVRTGLGGANASSKLDAATKASLLTAARIDALIQDKKQKLGQTTNANRTSGAGAPQPLTECE